MYWYQFWLWIFYVLVWQATITKKLSKNKVKKTINQTDLVPIIFGVLISKKKAPKKQVQNKMAYMGETGT